MTKRIVVAGDMACDVVVFPQDRGELDGMPPRTQNWQMFPSHGEIRLPGGAALTAAFIEQLTPDSRSCVTLHATVAENELLRSYVHVGIFHKTPKDKAQKSKDRIWRVSERGGYSAPDLRKSLGGVVSGNLWMDAALLVLDDAGNGFRDETIAKDLVDAAAAAQMPILLKMSRPIADALAKPPSLIEALRKAKSKGSPVVLVLDMWNLRADGMDVSRSLSWERTATDFACSMLVDDRFAGLATCADFMVVRAGLEGALLVERQDEIAGRSIQLLYDPSRIEGDIEDETLGKMIGYGAAFTAALAHHLVFASNGSSSVAISSARLREGAAAGLIACRRLARNGYGQTDEKGRTIPCMPNIAPKGNEQASIVDIKAGLPSRLSRVDRLFAWVHVPTAAAWWKSSPPSWRILNEFSSVDIRRLGIQMLRDSGIPVDAAGIPVARFGGLCAIDRFEIEGYRSLRVLIREYMLLADPPRPLCVAVFGQPGCGKSFGVKQIAQVVLGEKPEMLTFNLAEFDEVDELKRSLHLVHDKTRNGVVPLVFFDEFDCDFGGRLGWLKHLLAPMQDGTFRDAEHEHPIGKAIFVFAGGTSHSFKQFIDRSDGEESKDFISMKGPDFVSRLRGYVNVVGPCGRAASDFAAILRRAGVLQYNLREHAAKLASAGFADPDLCVCREVAYALLYTPEIRHGLRSIEAIIQMSRLSGLREFNPSALPSRAQLDLHLDARQFYDLLSAADLVLEDESLARMARGAHEGYRQANWPELSMRKDSDATKFPWPAGSTRADGTVDSNYQQVELIPLRVTSNGYQVVKRAMLKAFSGAASFTPCQLQTLARDEHDRWNAQKVNAGWRYGPGLGKDEKLRLHGDIVDWASLPASEQRKDLDAVARIPIFLEESGYAMTDIRPPLPPPTKEPAGAAAAAQDGKFASGPRAASSPRFEAYAIIRQGNELLVCEKQGARTLPGCPVPPEQRVDLALVQHLRAAGVKCLSVRLRYAACEMSEGGNGCDQRCGLFFECDLMDEHEQSIASPDWPKLIEGTRWETIEVLVNDGTLDSTVREMLKRVISWENRETRYR